MWEVKLVLYANIGIFSHEELRINYKKRVYQKHSRWTKVLYRSLIYPYVDVSLGLPHCLNIISLIDVGREAYITMTTSHETIRKGQTFPYNISFA